MKKQIGTGPCFACGQTIPFKLADSGALSVCCPWCDFSAYAKAGTQARRIVESKMKPDTVITPEPKPAPGNETDNVSGLPMPPMKKKATATIFG